MVISVFEIMLEKFESSNWVNSVCFDGVKKRGD